MYPVTLNVINSASNSMYMLSEAIETHGKLININFQSLPKEVKDRIIEEGKKNGMTKDQVEAMMAQADLELDSKDEQFSKDDSDTYRKFSLHGKDAYEGLYMHSIEAYNKEQDEAILASENIVKAYNAMIDADFKKAYSYAETYINLMKRAQKGSESAKNKLEKFSQIDKLQSGAITAAQTIIAGMLKDIEEDNDGFFKSKILRRLFVKLYIVHLMILKKLE